MNLSVRTFKTLIQREMWEHRGAFLYTPLIVAGVLTLLLLMSAGSMSFWQFKIDGVEAMTAGALKLAETQIPAEQLEAGVTGSLWGTAILWQSVMFIVLFFFCIGTLYDDRRDRSVLFWKSMPVSDLETVISKLAMALVVAPLLMIAGMIVGQILLLLISGLILLAHGGSPWKLIWSHAHPFSVWGQFLAVQGVQALYLLPLYGWLMLAGAFARGKPFLWAVLPPVVFAIIESFVGFTANFSISKVIWEFILRRLASGFAPISFSANFGDHNVQSGFSGTRFAADFADVMNRLMSADLWIGVAIGVAFLAAAVYLRRYRDESTS
ncbi:MAG: ABC-2 transporter permease [Lysobacterales bacterium]